VGLYSSLVPSHHLSSSGWLSRDTFRGASGCLRGTRGLKLGRNYLIAVLMLFVNSSRFCVALLADQLWVLLKELLTTQL
jgi:hypothetical protein